MPEIISMRPDADMLAALTELGVTPDGRNRTKVIKEAIMFYAALRREDDLDALDRRQRRNQIDSAIALLRSAR